MKHYEGKKPYIKLLYVDGCFDLAEIISFSLEENGVPFRIVLDKSHSYNGKDYNALGLFALVGNDGVKVFSDKYKAEEPVFELKYANNKNVKDIYLNLRSIGNNMANIIHKKSFKEIKHGIYVKQ